MGFYFRKSINLGPIRLNFSKSGVGVSAGVKGARISTGPRGTYISAGRGGFYYRQKLGANPTESAQSSTTGKDHTNWFKTSVEVPQGQILESIKPPHKSALPAIVHVSYIALTIGAIFYLAWYGFNRLPHTSDGRLQARLLLFTVPWAVWILGVIVHYLVSRSSHVTPLHPLFYELDKGGAARFASIRRACESLAQSKSIWTLASPPAGSYLMQGASPAWIGHQQPPLISTNVEVWALAVGNWRMFFLPDSLYIFQNNAYSTVPYEKLRFSYAERRAFVFNGHPPDALIIDRTWQHTRKDGLPDLRYNVNPMIPIVLYGLVNIESTIGWSLIIQTSNVDAAKQFVNQVTSVMPGAGRREYQRAQNNNQKHEYKERKSYSATKPADETKSPHEVLGVARDASLKDITEAYHVLARKNHPDKVVNMDQEFRELAERRMKEINAAYQELKERFQG